MPYNLGAAADLECFQMLLFCLSDDPTSDLSIRRKVFASCIFLKIYFRDEMQHPLRTLLPEIFVPVQSTRRVVSLHEVDLDAVKA